MFATHFRRHVVPRLRRLATAEAICVVRGVETWTGAFDGLMGYARRYGALHLPDDALDDLDDWLSATLLEEIDRQEAALKGITESTSVAKDLLPKLGLEEIDRHEASLSPAVAGADVR